MGFNNEDRAKISTAAENMRRILENKYGRTSDCMMGKCIEASDALVNIYKNLGYRANAKRVWCLYECFELCSNYCFEEHWVVEILKGQDKCFVDITLNQFQWAFNRALPRIYISNKLPKFLLTRKPGKTILDKCGWNDWYNYGDYVNNFEYY